MIKQPEECTVILFGCSALEYWRLKAGALPAPVDILEEGHHGGRDHRNGPYSQRAVSFALENGLSLPIHTYVYEREQKRPSKQVACHVWPAMPRLPQCHEVASGVLVPPPAVALAQASTSMDFVDVLLLALELAGNYVLSEDHKLGMVETKRPLMRPDELEEVAHVLAGTGIHGSKLLSDVLRYVTSGSKSPTESKLYVLFSLDRRRGGFGIPGIQLNPRIGLGSISRMSLDLEGIRPDLLEPKGRTALEYQSDLHLLEGRENDDRRADALAAVGIRAFQVNKIRARSLRDLSGIAYVMAKRCGLRRPKPSERALAKREKLHARLFLSGS